MRMQGWKRTAAWIFVGFLAIAVSLLALEGSIQLTVRSTGDRAAARFGGDRVKGLMSVVECDSCSLRERDMAVWALGELRDRRALPVLKPHFTNAKCNHATGLCQYELGKAIMKIEGTWSRHSAEFRRSRP
jgi:hypothetical protein